MYGVSGERFLDERELPWLPGYENSKPVRIGNAASGQFQLDVYGEVIDVLYRTGSHLQPDEASFHRKTPPTLQVGLAALAHVEEVWREPDAGIWEVRGPPRHFVHSKLMAWVAFDRAVKGLSRFSDRFPVERWSRLRDEIHADICARGFDPKVGAFMQYYGADLLDASVLLAPIVGFLPADDPRIAGTVRAIEQRLLKNGFVLRYEQPDAGDRRPAARRGRVPGVQLLVRRCACHARPAQGGAGDVRAADRAAQRRRAAGGGIRPRRAPDARQFPAGLQPRRADQLRLSDWRRR